MLKNEYPKQEDIPENQRGAYVQKGDKWVLDDLESSHPLVVNSRTLKTEKQQAETAKINAERERDDAKEALSKANVLQPGQRAVAKADADLLEKVKAEGVTTAEAFTTLKTEHGSYKATAEAAQAAKHAADVAEAMGWDKDKASRLVPKHFDLSTVELRDGADGKKQPIAKVKQADGSTVVEKPFADVVKTTPELSDLAPLLTANGGGTRVPGSTGGGGAPGGQKSVVDSFIESRDKAAASRPNPFSKPAAPAASA